MLILLSVWLLLGVINVALILFGGSLVKKQGKKQPPTEAVVFTSILLFLTGPVGSVLFVGLIGYYLLNPKAAVQAQNNI